MTIYSCLSLALITATLKTSFAAVSLRLYVNVLLSLLPLAKLFAYVMRCSWHYLFLYQITFSSIPAVSLHISSVDTLCSEFLCSPKLHKLCLYVVFGQAAVVVSTSGDAGACEPISRRLRHTGTTSALRSVTEQQVLRKDQDPTGCETC